MLRWNGKPVADAKIPAPFADWRCKCYVLGDSVGLLMPRAIQRNMMKKTTTTKKAPAPATKLTAPAPALKSTAAPKIRKPAAPAAPAIVTKPSGLRVTIIAKIDIGFGNFLFARGDGGGLGWGKGTPLECTADTTWTLVVPVVEKPFAFKLLRNDADWSAGENYMAAPGDAVTVTPVF